MSEVRCYTDLLLLAYRTIIVFCTEKYKVLMFDLLAFTGTFVVVLRKSQQASILHFFFHCNRHTVTRLSYRILSFNAPVRFFKLQFEAGGGGCAYWEVQALVPILNITRPTVRFMLI
jgi:hypothetical protein